MALLLALLRARIDDEPQDVDESDVTELRGMLQEFRGLLQEFRGLLQELRDVSQAGPSTLLAAAASAPAPEPPAVAVAPATAAVALAIELARQTLVDAEARHPVAPASGGLELDLAAAKQRLEHARGMLAASVPSAKQTAKAYDFVREARQLVQRAARPGEEKPVKDAALVVREVLALQLSLRTTSSTSFKDALVDSFERSPDSELNSQLHQSKNKIVELGRERAAFDVAWAENGTLGKIFGRTLSDDHRTQLFAAYSTASDNHRTASQLPASTRSVRKAKPRQQLAVLDSEPTDYGGDYGSSLRCRSPGLPVSCDPLEVMPSAALHGLDVDSRSAERALPALGERNRVLPFHEPTYYEDRLEAQLQATSVAAESQMCAMAAIIDVDTGCCLRRAQRSLGNACLVLGPGRTCEFIESSSLLRLTAPGRVAYVPDVLVFADSEGLVTPWRLSMIYAPDAVKGPGKEIREWLVNVSRIALRHGHDELIISKDQPESTGGAAEVEAAVRDVLGGGGVPAGAFRCVTVMAGPPGARPLDD